MSEMTVNVPLLRKAVEWAEAEAAKPWELSRWTQDFFETNNGTQICWPSDVEVESGWAASEEAQKATACGTCYCIAGFVSAELMGERPTYPWEHAGIAEDALGLTVSQSNALFDGGNTIEQVREIAESIAGERL